MSQLIYRGILNSLHSWTVVGTELCVALHKIGVDVAVQSTDGTTKLDSRLKGIQDIQKKRSPIGLGYTIPRNLKQFNTDKKICIYNYETTQMPQGWISDMNQNADLILPSSTFAKNIFIKNGIVGDRVHVLPHGVDISKYNPDIEPMDLHTDKFKFLCVAAPHARKGLDILLEAYGQEFSASDKVMLVLRTQIKGQRASYEIDVKSLVQQFRIRYPSLEIKLVSNNVENLAELYNACDAFVTATRSECFCLPILEAMACKIPVIATGYGGHTDFATSGNSFPIAYKMVQAPKSMQYWHYNERSKLAEPNKGHLRTLMRYVFNHRKEATERAERAYREVIPKYTWENVAHQFVDLVNNQKWGQQCILQCKDTPVEVVQKGDNSLMLNEALSQRRNRLERLKQEIMQKQAEFQKIESQVLGLEEKQESSLFKVLEKPYSGKTTIVILNYNTKESLNKCLTSIEKHTKDFDHEVIVIDNGSTDGSVELLKKNKGIKLILNSSNVGVSRGWNQGIVEADPENDIVVLNSDIVVTRDWLEILNRVAYQDKAIGVVGCRIKGMGAYNNNQILHTGAIIQKNGMGQENEWGIALTDFGQCQVNKQAQIVVGACMYLKRETLAEVGLFDEQFSPAYFEDSDMCLQIAKAGYKVFYCGQVTLFHEHGATGKANRIDVGRLLETNRSKFVSKWSSYLDSHDGGVEIRGPVYGLSGYAEACRNLTTGLWENNVDVAYRPVMSHPSEQLDRGLTNLVVKDAIGNSTLYDTTIVFYIADFFVNQFKGKGRRIGYTMLEVDGVPKSWVQHCNAYLTELWVPSTFNQQTFRKSGVQVPIKVVPLGIDVGRFNPYINPLIPKKKDKFRFLCICEMGERKNVHMLMRAFQAEFKKNEAVELMLRVTNNDPSINVESELSQYDLRNVTLLSSQSYGIHEMPSLYKSCDAFVLPSSGEGWGLPYMEAMAVGLPTIGTGWSANTDFMNNENSFLINIKKTIPAVARCPYYRGFNWALPDTQHLRYLMRYVYEHQEEAKTKGMQASQDILNNYSLAKVGSIVKGHLLG